MNEQQAIQEVLANLRVENPCPMILARMRGETNGEYYCKSCDKNLVDFRNCSDEEIVDRINKDENLCGIFRQSQLGAQSSVRYGFWQRAAFCALMILSFVGFNVKPLNAQSSTKDSTTTTKSQPTQPTDTKTQTISVGWGLDPEIKIEPMIRGLPMIVRPEDLKPAEKKRRRKDDK